MKNQFLHIILLSVEIAALLAVLGYFISSALPIREWAYAAEPQELSFDFASGQDAELNCLVQCCAYCATWDDREFSERQKVVDKAKTFSIGERHSLTLPPRIMQVRLDFYPRDRQKLPDKVPVLSNVRLGRRSLSDGALVPFRYPNDGYFGYMYKRTPFMNGWWRVIVPAGVIMWIVLVLCLWRYFCQMACGNWGTK